ncbi:succinate CoA transferase [Alicyclobacillaceae bacterium I2511]|nr:succinate CoA transferase [Alicyclobacillaceae bacterium I2511]
MYEDRIRHAGLRGRVVTAEEAQAWIQNGMTVGVSGFTRAGDVKAVPKALAAQVKKTGEVRKINLYSGASLGESDPILSESGVINSRLPFIADAVTRKAINRGDIRYMDQHLSHTVEILRTGVLGHMDLAIIEATAITENGGIIPTTAVGNSPVFVEKADKIIIEVNLAMPLNFEGLHDIYIPQDRPSRQPIPIMNVSDRIGVPYITCDPDKILGIVISNESDSPSDLPPADAETERMAGHILELLSHEVRRGRLPATLGPLQSGVGQVANAVLSGLRNGPFEGLTVYTEVAQDAVFELMDAGKVAFASANSLTLSQSMQERVLTQLDAYRDKMVLRPQELTNHPEVIRRLGVIAINTALEVDVYGNVNSTHVGGTHMMNGIGGSGDFARNAALTIFVTKSLAKDGKISSIIPFTPHVDHTEHDVDIIVTEQGIADLRGLTPRERSKEILAHVVHPMYREALADYVQRATARGGQTPHLLSEALSWHTRFEQTGDMRLAELVGTVNK